MFDCTTGLLPGRDAIGFLGFISPGLTSCVSDSVVLDRGEGRLVCGDDGDECLPFLGGAGAGFLCSEPTELIAAA